MAHRLLAARAKDKEFNYESVTFSGPARKKGE